MFSFLSIPPKRLLSPAGFPSHWFSLCPSLWTGPGVMVEEQLFQADMFDQSPAEEEEAEW